MKKINLFSILVLAVMTLSVVSCVKDADSIDGAGNKYYNMPAASKAFQLAPISVAPAQKAIVQIIRNVTSAAQLNTSSSLTLSFDDAIITAYNATVDTADWFTALPVAAYSPADQTVNFAAGETSKFVEVLVDPTVLDDLSQKYAIGIKMANTGDYQIANNDKAVLRLIIKNQYDGEYHASGLFTHPTAGPRDIDEDKTLSTVNANTVETNFADLGGSGWTMQLTVNADNTVTLTPTGAANPGTEQFGENRYDPDTKSFILNYKYNTAAPRIINETITLK